MSADFTAEELYQRLEALDQNLGAAANRIMESGVSTADQQRQIEILRLKSSVLRQRLVEAKSSDWNEVKESLHTDWKGLSESVERWVKDTDQDFGQGLRSSLR
jgi:hypothetical protein